MEVHFNLPLDVSTHFTVPVDLAPWGPLSHQKTPQGWTPVRDRATYTTWSKSLEPVTPDAQALEAWYGIYLFALDVPKPTLYVGIASNDSKSSEGVLNRLKKHRVKATGSHVGSSPDTIGGVHHPENWRDFATERFTALGGPGDLLKDARVAVSKFNGTVIQPKADLERFESAIIGNQAGILDAIVAKLWPAKNASHINLLNGTTGRDFLSPDDRIVLW